VVERLVKAVFRVARETPGPDGVTGMVGSLVDGLVASAAPRAAAQRRALAGRDPEALAFMKALASRGVAVRGHDIVDGGAMAEMHARWPAWAQAYEVFERERSMRQVMDAVLGRNGASASMSAPAANDQAAAASTERAEPAIALRRRRASL
jgi:hypothetical protein